MNMCLCTKSGVVIQDKYLFNSKKPAAGEIFRNPGYVFPQNPIGGDRFGDPH